MRILLTILIFIFAPVLTEQGLQIGEININNQKIKIMKMNLNNPAFLQGASNVVGAGEYISFVDSTGNPRIHQLSAKGNVTIQSIYKGEPTIQTVTNPTNTGIQIQSDANTEVILFGKITKLHCQPAPIGYTHLTSIDVSHAKSLTYLDCEYNQLTSLNVSANTALTYLDCASNQLTSLNVSANTALTCLYCEYNQLTSLNVSANTALTELSCESNSTLLTIDGIGVNNDVATSIATAITDATSVDGTVTLRQGDEFNQTIIDAAMDKGWDVQYYQ